MKLKIFVDLKKRVYLINGWEVHAIGVIIIEKIGIWIVILKSWLKFCFKDII
jgi:hypothetical protein